MKDSPVDPLQESVVLGARHHNSNARVFHAVMLWYDLDKGPCAPLGREGNLGLQWLPWIVWLVGHTMSHRKKAVQCAWCSMPPGVCTLCRQKPHMHELERR